MTSRSDRIVAAPSRFADPGEPIYAVMISGILVQCPKCGSCAVHRPIANEASRLGWLAPRRLVCPNCGLVRRWSSEQGTYRRWGESPVRDDYFREILWLRAPFGGEELWAYNWEHLALIERYVAAANRTRTRNPKTGWSNREHDRRIRKVATRRRRAGRRPESQEDAARDRLDSRRTGDLRAAVRVSHFRPHDLWCILARLHGLVAFLFACYGAGTPAHDNFLTDRSRGPVQITEKPFVAALPQRLLSHPSSGALAVLGHVERAWGYSIKPPGVGTQLQPFRNLIGRILSGEPVGHATKDFSEKYAALSAELLSQLDETQPGNKPSDNDLAWTWIERNDAQNYVVLGDPAVRIRVDQLLT